VTIDDVPWKPITTVDELVARFENSVFDFKTIYDLEKEDVRFDIASDVAAFANAFGGSILVGVHERGGRAIGIPGIAHVSRLLDEIATALRQHCVPVPGTPVEHALTVTPEVAARILASGATTPNSPVTVVALNVQPDSRGPIGVRGSPRGQSLEDFYKFPVRINDQTRFLDPTELPMWMNTHERRIAVRIRAIPEGSAVRVFCEGDNPTVNLVGVNEGQAVATFSLAGEGEANVPLTHVTAVWQEPRDSVWSLRIRGRIFRNAGYAFEPVGAGS
jgi:schlafen family protein